MSWPNAADPFYLANTTDNNARRSYYNVNSTPTLNVDGTEYSYTVIQSAIQARMATPSPLWLDLIASTNGNTLNLTARAVANQNISGNYVIQMVIMDRYDYLASPNGQNNHYHPMRDFAPSASGQSFSAVANDTVNYYGTFTLSPSWSLDNLDVACFVQNNITKEILQSRCEMVPLNTPAVYYISNTIQDPNANGRAEPGEAVNMSITLGNQQFYQPATNVVATLSENDPDLTVTTATVNYPNIPTGQQAVNSTPFVIQVSPSAQPHQATLHLHVVANPLQTAYDTDFQIYVDWQEVLIVDDDGGNNFEIWYQNDLESLNLSFETWEANTQGEVSVAMLAHFPTVIWFTSVLTGAISTGEETAMSTYLNNGGHLLLSGEQIDEQYAGTPFYSNVLHATSLGQTGFFLLTGVAGDPISGGTTLLLVGAGGAGNSYAPSCISPVSPATTLYTYDNSGLGAGLKWSSGNSKLVYFAFNFEAASGMSSTPRVTVLNNILDWFGPAGTPQASITLTPFATPIVIPPSGGSFNFNVAVANNLSTALTFDGWIMMQLPSGSWYGPVLGPINLTLPGNASINRNRTQNIPGNAPAGTYTYEGRTGAYPNTIWDTDSFTFSKSGSGDDGSVGDWNNFGESFTLEEQEIGLQPVSFLVCTVTPNPFNPRATLTYALPQAGNVSLVVYDLSGRAVAELTHGWQDAGSHQVTFDGAGLASGLYLYRLQAGDQEASGKMMLLK